MRIYGDMPRFQMISLAEDNLSGGEIGQAEPSIMDEAGTDTPIEAPEESYFHSITIPGANGEEDEVLNFKDPKELNDRFLENRLRRADYTKKTQELSNERKSWEKKIADYEEKEQMLTRTSNKYNQFNELLGDLAPEQLQELVSQIKGVKQEELPGWAKELKAENESYKKEREAKEAEARRLKQEEADKNAFDMAHKYLKNYYSDYDGEAIMKFRDELMGVDPNMAHQKLAETFYWAMKGKGSKPEDPKGQPRTTTSTVKAAGAADKELTIKELQQRAVAELE